MASNLSCPEEIEAMRRLGELVRGFGLSHVVYLLAEIADEQREVAAGFSSGRRIRCAARG